MSVIDESWNFTVDLQEEEYKSFIEFKTSICRLSKGISKTWKEIKAKDFNNPGRVALNSDNELKAISERNKQLVHEITAKVEEYEKQQQQYGNLKSDQKLLAQEIKETHEAFLMAKKYYKKFLKIYFSIESRSDGKQAILLQYFTEMKKDSKTYSVYLLKDLKTKVYEVTQMTPGQEMCEEVQRKMNETNDVPGALCYIRHIFLNMKKNKG